MKNARHNQTIYRVSLPYLLVSAVTCTSRCTLWDVTVRLTTLGRFQVKVCHKAEEILCCHLLLQSEDDLAQFPLASAVLVIQHEVGT